MPKGTIIGHVTLHDAEGHAPCARENDVIFPRFGGRFPARGGRSEIVEGQRHPRHVIVAGPSHGDAPACYTLRGFQENLKIRHVCADRTIRVVEGV